MPDLAIYLFGTPNIELHGHSLTVDTRKAIALLAYLAVTGKRHSRDSLATLLWPEYDQSHARSALRRTLSVLQKALDEGFLLVTRDAISLELNERVEVDVVRFRQQLFGRRRKRITLLGRQIETGKQERCDDVDQDNDH